VIVFDRTKKTYCMIDNIGKIIIKPFPSDESLSVFQNNLPEDIVHTIKEEPITEEENAPNDLVQLCL
jgi:hypothetical protein